MAVKGADVERNNLFWGGEVVEDNELWEFNTGVGY